MVTFGTGYDMPMDRGYGIVKASPSENSTNDVGVGIKDIGVSLALGPVPNVSAIGAKMRAGSKTAELTFMGAGKGSGQGHTPEYYGKLQRQALREMQKAGKFDFTTHASVGVYGLAGMDQQGNFSGQQKNMAVNEIKRAIEFAGDVAQGGPVVVHTGEFQRPLSEADWNQEGEFKNKFEMYSKEEERATFRVVDARTGGMIQEARKNKKVARPIWKRYEEDDEMWKEHGGKGYNDSKGNKVSSGDYVDYYGNKVDRASRVAKYGVDKDGQKRFLTTQLDWDDLKNEAKEMTTEARKDWEYWVSQGRPNPETSNDPKIKDSIWAHRFMQPEFSDIGQINQINVKPEEAYIIATFETNAAHSKGWAISYGGQFDDSVDKVKKLEKAKKFYEEIENTTDESEKWRLKRQADQLAMGLVPTDAKLPTEIIQRELESYRDRIEQARQASASQWAQAEEALETIKFVRSADSYALEESYDAYAEAGMKAYEQTKQLEKEGNLKKPISVAMENLFPESYGAHPQELINLVKNSRVHMEQMLIKNKGMSQEQAHKSASEHIGATFDTGHLNMWKKYWKGNPKSSVEDNDKDFKNWSLKQVENMAKAGIIQHLHLVDNYGYQDDHLAPGEGNTPVKEMVEIFKKHGFKGEMIVEPGADFSTDTSGFNSVMKTWKMFGSPVYGAASGVARSNWGQVQYGHFGEASPPYFTVGAYSPSEEWQLWSGVPLD